MLLRFAVSNFGSLRDRQELSLIASRLKGEATGLIEAPELRNETIVPAAVIYGANASGKSNLVKAVSRMRYFVLNSHREGAPGEAILLKTFALDPEYGAKPNTFAADFICNNALYSYAFGATADRFIAESLHVTREGRSSMLFERDLDGFNFGRSLRGRNKVIEDLTRPNSLFLSAAAQNNHEELGHVANFFRRLRIAGVANIQTRNVTQMRAISSRLAEEGLPKKAIDLLRAIDIGITDFKVDALPAEESIGSAAIRRFVQNDFFGQSSDKDETNKQMRFRLGHPGINGSVYFDLADESAGTLQLLTILGFIFYALDEGATIIVDEFGSRMHTRASEIILSLFNNKKTNTKGGQIIVATHDTNLLNASGLRRDQVWFTEKDVSGATHLYPLTDFVTRREDNFERGYLQGRFGAIPFAGSVDDLPNGS